MTNPRDDLMALADRLRALVFRQGQIDWDALIKIEIDLRLAASRPAPVDREAVAAHFLACAAGSDIDWASEQLRLYLAEPHQGDCPLAETQGPVTCSRCCAEDAFTRADTILSLLRPAEPVEAALGGWTYEIQHGPDGEAAYAWVYDKEHFLVCTAKIHHAKSIVDRMNAATSKSPDTSAAVIQSHALKQALDCLSEIAGAHIPDCPAHYAGEELAWAQRHVGSLRLKAEIARDGIAAAIRQLPTSKD